MDGFLRINRDDSASRQHRALLAFGVVGPVVFLSLLLGLGALWRGYDPTSRFLSELGAVDSPFRSLMNFGGFLLLGISVTFFGFGLHAQLERSWLSRAVLGCLLIAGTSMIAVGLLPCDPGCVNVTTVGRLHTLTSIPQSIALPSAAVLAFPIFLRDRRWGRSWATASLTLGVLSMSMGALMETAGLESSVGLVQRLGMGASLLWVLVVAARQLWLIRPQRSEVRLDVPG